ncbi:MAG: hypothetical protein ACOYO2_00975 [Mycobacterium sp.]
MRGPLVGLAAAVLGAATSISISSAFFLPQATADTGCATGQTGYVDVCDTPNTQIFGSPSGNIYCAITNGLDNGSTAAAWTTYCKSNTPPQTVSMDSQGLLTVCSDVSCMGNPMADGIEPELPYGESKLFGPFICVSETDGMNCTVAASGRGFTISKSGIDPVG